WAHPLILWRRHDGMESEAVSPDFSEAAAPCSFALLLLVSVEVWNSVRGCAPVWKSLEMTIHHRHKLDKNSASYPEVRVSVEQPGAEFREVEVLRRKRKPRTSSCRFRR